DFINYVTTSDRAEFEAFMKGAPFNFAQDTMDNFILTYNLGGAKGWKGMFAAAQKGKPEQLNRMLKQLGKPNASQSEVEAMWLDAAWDAFQKPTKQMREHLNKVWQNTLTAKRNNTYQDTRIAAQAEPGSDDLDVIYDKAQKVAVNKVAKQME